MQRPEVGQPARIHVRAAEVQPASRPLVKLTVQAGQDSPAGPYGLLWTTLSGEIVFPPKLTLSM
jgi:hypothetical protein